MRSTRRCVVPLLLAGALACAADEDPANDDAAGSSGGAETSGAETTGGDATTGDSSLPAACSPDASPFLSADCLAGLRGACLTHADETACTSQAEFVFDGYTVRCAWANVITYADATSCTVASEAGRCEATLDSECLAPCTAIPSELEIIELCNGPLGPWSAVDAEPGEYAGTCAPNTQPPAPALCDCAPTSCAVE